MNKKLIIALVVLLVMCMILVRFCRTAHVKTPAFPRKTIRMGISPDSESHNMVTYDTTITYNPAASGSVWQVRITRPVNYFTAGNPDTASRRMIITMQGEGQVGTNPSILLAYGPHYWLNTVRSDGTTWDGGITIGNGTHYPIYVTIAPAAANVRPNYQSNLIHALINEFHPRGLKVDFMGLSMGNQCNIWTLIDSTTLGLNTMMQFVESVVDQEGENGSSYGGGYTSTFPNDLGHWAATYHGRFLGLEGDDDDRGVWQNTQNINDSLGAHGITNDSAYFSYQNFGGGGHGSEAVGNDPGVDIDCWNYWWDIRTTDLTSTNSNINWSYQSGTNPHTIGTYTGPPESILQWVLRAGDTTLIAVPNAPPLAKTQKWVGTLGEYAPGFIDSISRAVVFSANLGLTGNNGAGTGGIPLAITDTAVFVRTGNTLHGPTYVDRWGNVYCTGGNDQGQLGLGYVSANPVTTLQQIMTDSRGLPFTNIWLVQGSYVQVGDTTCEGQFFVMHGTLSDTVFYAGRKKYGIGGDGDATSDDTLSSPTLMFGLPSGYRINAISGEEAMAYVRSDGTVWTWGSAQFGSPLGRTPSGTNYATPVQLTGFNSGEVITQITGGGAPGFIALGGSGTILYGWGTHSGYLGNAANTAYTTPTLLTTNITSNLFNGTTRTSITQITSSSTNYHVLLNDGSVWGWGDKGMGNMGDGIEANMTSPGGTSTPWFIDPGGILVLPQTLPEQITGQTNYVAIYGGQLFCFDFAALDANGNLYFCGRDKGSVIPNGVIECTGDGGTLGNYYPNSWDVPFLTITSPYSITSTVQQGCLGCYNGTVTANCYSCGTTTSATANAGSNQMVASPAASLSGTAGSSGVVVYHTWSQISGPTSVISLPSSLSPTVALTTTGTYVYQLSVQDQGFHTATSTVTVTYGSAPPVQTAYYFSVGGSDANTCSLTSPCATLAHLTTLLTNATIQAGDTVYFARGSTFNGELAITVSGASGSPIVFTSYGTGNMPVIGGMTTLSGWTAMPGNVWRTTYTGPNPNFLVSNGKLITESRTPNLSTGYYEFTAASSSNTTIFDAVNAPNASTGSRLRVRSSPFTIDTTIVTAATSTTLTVSPALTYNNVGGDGWFIIGTLPDTLDEWRDTAGQVQIYSTGTPSGVQVPAQDTVVYATGQYLTFSNLSIQGGNNALFYFAFQSTGDITLSNDSLLYAYDGIFSRGASGVTINGCTILQMGDNAIFKENPTFLWTVENSVIRYVGMLPGMGGTGNAGTYQGINEVQGDSADVLSGNILDSIGYIGLSASGSGFVISNNTIGDFCQVKEDGGGIYTWIPSLVSYARSRAISGNYLYNGGGPMSHNGVSTDFSSAACGIYLDNFSSQVQVTGNTVSGVNSISYFNHGPSNTFTANTGYNAGYAEFLCAELSGGPVVTGLTFTNNTLYGLQSGDALLRLITPGNDLTTFGTINNNHMGHAILTAPFYYQSSSGSSFQTLSGWTIFTGYDASSSFVTRAAQLYGNPSASPESFGLPAPALDLSGILYQTSVTVPARSGLILSAVGVLNQTVSPIHIIFR